MVSKNKVESTATHDGSSDLPRRNALERLARAPRARRASYKKTADVIEVELLNGVVFRVPVQLIQILGGAKPSQIGVIEILVDGLYLRWPELDEDLRVESLLEGTFGTARWMISLRQHLSNIGKKGGRSRIRAKIDAARVNGSKGGRPKKVETI